MHVLAHSCTIFSLPLTTHPVPQLPFSLPCLPNSHSSLRLQSKCHLLFEAHVPHLIQEAAPFSAPALFLHLPLGYDKWHRTEGSTRNPDNRLQSEPGLGIQNTRESDPLKGTQPSVARPGPWILGECTVLPTPVPVAPMPTSSTGGTDRDCMLTTFVFYSHDP